MGEHFLTGRHFAIVIDPRSVSFVHDTKNHGKFLNATMLRWRIELARFDVDIVYRSAENNCAPDALSRAFCGSMHKSTLNEYMNLCVIRASLACFFLSVQRIYLTPWKMSVEQ